MLDTPLVPEQTTYAQAVKTSGDTLLALIDEMLDFSKIEAGKLDLEARPFGLATLVEDQRAALLLVVLEGLSYREVAEVQGVPIGTVMSRLARARAQLRTYLDGERPPLRRIK